ncbi:MAG: hypothetical protein ABIJ27_08425 [Candidatus Omnitrophota bacterium]
MRIHRHWSAAMNKRIPFLALTLLAAFCGALQAGQEARREEGFAAPGAIIEFTRAEDFRAMIPVRRVRKIPLPEGYHEGILVEGNTLWVNNGKGIDTWLVDLAAGKLVAAIKPAGDFTEGITASPDGGYWVTDWVQKKLYRVEIEEKRMTARSERAFDPFLPAGVVWTGSRLYMIVWRRGIGTKYFLLEMNEKGDVIRTARIRDIPEPSQLAWDGVYLWISSWFNGRVFKVDPGTFELKGYFRSNIKKLTGIAWDGKRFWLTGTNEDLYQVEFIE